jgi:hypothetical protein
MSMTHYIITIMSVFSFLFGGCSKQSTTPIAMSNKELLVRGWSDTELRRILADFQRLSGNRQGFDLNSRPVLVAGRATITSDFLPSDQSLVGKRILVYVPSEDKRYDEVFAQAEGQSYEFPFTRTGFIRAQEPRLRVGVSDIK